MSERNSKISSNNIEFELHAPDADAVELCFFDQSFKLKNTIWMQKNGDGFWKTLCPKQNFIYAYRLYGDWLPRAGKWFNPNKFLFDPSARVVARAPRWDRKLFPFQNSDFELCTESNIDCAPLAAVLEQDFNWGADTPPNISWSDTVIYEAHVKGLTQLHPEVKANIRGSYLGLASEPIIKHLKKIGVTAIELLPIQAFFSEYALHQNGLTNYWGYNPYSWFAPEPSYASVKELGAEVFELKQAVKTLHAAGIEVILDIVFNHSAEGLITGPCLSLRGIDNSSYISETDYTGCGNTLDFSKSNVRELATKALESWVEDYHVDGFRFDLATTLVRNQTEVNPLQGFFAELLENPLLRSKKLIAEPWDLGPSNYQLGRFPPRISEWNDTYRDTIRKYWAGWDGLTADLATKISGSSDKFFDKTPLQSINFVTAHDGFTLRDLVSYQQKQNEKNGENNRDGSENNFSFNCGEEGETEKAEIINLRQQQIRNFFFTLFFSAGVPMLCSGDEIGKTQFGNNNAYCQDNNISWLNWNNLDYDFSEFVFLLAQLRRELKIFGQSEFFKPENLLWFNQAGKQMSSSDWHNNKALSALYLSKPNNIVILYNSSQSSVEFSLQRDSFLRVDTSNSPYHFTSQLVKGSYLLSARAAALFMES